MRRVLPTRSYGGLATAHPGYARRVFAADLDRGRVRRLAEFRGFAAAGSGHPDRMGRGTRTVQIVGSSTRSLEEAIRDGMARAARRGARWARITRISARSSDGEREVYRVRLLIGLHLA
jgi:flavin-binding protein dodecin